MSVFTDFRHSWFSTHMLGLGPRRGGVLALALFAIAATRANSETLTPYPLTICIVTGDKLPKEFPVVFSYQGREIKTCCDDCVDEFYKDPASFAAKIDEAAKRTTGD